jgi:hypothetical protein
MPSLAPQCGIWISTFPFAYFYAANTSNDHALRDGLLEAQPIGIFL